MARILLPDTCSPPAVTTPARSLTPAFGTAGVATTPRLWERPDPALSAAGIEGETVVARVRVLVMALLLIAPIYNLVQDPTLPMFRTGFAVTLAANLIALGIWWYVERRTWRPWIGFASSIFDVSVVSLGLVSFFIVASPLVALNSKVTFEMYFLAILATSLRYDARICIVAGVLALLQYGGMWAVGLANYDLYDPSFVAAAGPYLPVDLAVRLLLLGIATVVAVTIVRRAQRLLYLAARDRLTGVFNRGHFDNALQQVVEVSSRTGQPLALALLDIDHFKSINDQHGHARGDQAIRAVADLLLQSMRRTDIVARYGGEEFVVLMPGTTPEAALVRIESLRATLVAKPLALGDGRSIALNYSAGVAGTPGDRFFAESAGLGAAKAPDILVGLADERLLAAKRAGRGRCYGPEIDPPAPPAPRRSSGAQRQR